MPFRGVVGLAVPPIVPVVEKNAPSIVLQGFNQSTRDSHPVPSNNQVSSGSAPTFNYLKWKLDTDNELWFSSHSGMVEILSAADALADALPDADGDLDDGKEGDIFFRLQAGMWRFSGTVFLSTIRQLETYRITLSLIHVSEPTRPY